MALRSISLSFPLPNAFRFLNIDPQLFSRYHRHFSKEGRLSTIKLPSILGERSDFNILRKKCEHRQLRFYSGMQAVLHLQITPSDALFGVKNLLAFWARHYFSTRKRYLSCFLHSISRSSIFEAQPLSFLLVVVINRFGGISRITVTAQNLDFYHATRVTRVSFLYVKFMARSLVSLRAFYIRLRLWHSFFAVLSWDIRFCFFRIYITCAYALIALEMVPACLLD